VTDPNKFTMKRTARRLPTTTPNESKKYKSDPKRKKEIKTNEKENIPVTNTPIETPKKDVPQQCTICFENIQEKAALDSCLHNFCFECIFQWSKMNNTCPLCKARFHKLTKAEPKKKQKKTEKRKNLQDSRYRSTPRI